MVYTADNALTWEPITKTWLKKLSDEVLPPKMKEWTDNLFMTHIQNTIDLIRGKGFKEAIPTTNNNLIISMCRMMEMVLNRGVNIHKYEEDRLKKAVLKVFIWSLAWSFGGAIDSKHHSSFEVFLGTAFNISDLPRSSIFDSRLFESEHMDYRSWTVDMPKFQY